MAAFFRVIFFNLSFSDHLFSDNLAPSAPERPKSAKKKSPPAKEPSPPPAKKEEPAKGTSLAKLDDLPSLGGPGAKANKNKNDFDAFQFEDDFEDSA